VLRKATLVAVCVLVAIGASIALAYAREPLSGTLNCATTGSATFTHKGIPAAGTAPATARVAVRAKGTLLACSPGFTGTVSMSLALSPGATCASLPSTLATVDKSRLALAIKSSGSSARVNATLATSAFVVGATTTIWTLTSSPMTGSAYNGEVLRLTLGIANPTAVSACTSGTASLQTVTWSSSTVSIAGPSGSPASQTPRSPVSLAGLKLMNYYPSQEGWTNMWTHFDAATIGHDFAAMHSLGLNAVRVILQADTIGYPNPSSAMTGEVAQMVQLAAQNDLQVQLTLFDWWSSWTDIAGSKSWAAAVLAPYKNDPRIHDVELRNEIDYTGSSAMAWARTMIPYLQGITGTVPVTISVSGNAHPAGLQTLKNELGASQPDFYSFHFYDGAGSALSEFTQAKTIVAPLPLLIGETGFATGAGNVPSDPTLEAQQNSFYSTVFAATRSAGLPDPAPWIWQDVAAGASPNSPSPSSNQFRYGILRVDGSAKPAYATLQAQYRQG